MLSMSRYISIISGVGAGATVAQRQLIMRLITQNTALPPGIVVQFGNAASVGAYFGMSSEEYKRALAYFSFISKSINSPQLISFARWVNTAIAPQIVGDAVTKTISQFSSVTAGTLTLNDGATAYPISGINLSTATSLGGAAPSVVTLLQSAIRTGATGSTQLASATVSFNTNTNQFVIAGSVTGAGAISVTATGLATDLSQLLGLATGGTVLVAGQAADPAVNAISKSAAISNNFGSFCYLTGLATPLANSDIQAIAQWNDSQNNMYMYSVATSLSNLATLYALVSGYSGCALNVLSTTLPNDYVEQSPCEILASTNYNQPNAVQNYMFYQFASRNVTVSDDTTANTIDASRGNYIGVTQSAGQQLAFYQRGVLCGGSTAATDMSVYANEIWLKSSVVTAIMSAFLNLPAIPANASGVGYVIGQIQPIVDTAKTNGVISAGKPLTSTQQQYITLASGNTNAWRQVQSIGYWLNVTLSSYVNSNSNLTEWQASYTLIYSKGDVIRLVQGQDIMI